MTVYQSEGPSMSSHSVFLNPIHFLPPLQGLLEGATGRSLQRMMEEGAESSTTHFLLGAFGAVTETTVSIRKYFA